MLPRIDTTVPRFGAFAFVGAKYEESGGWLVATPVWPIRFSLNGQPSNLDHCLEDIRVHPERYQRKWES